MVLEERVRQMEKIINVIEVSDNKCVLIEAFYPRGQVNV